MLARWPVVAALTNLDDDVAELFHVDQPSERIDGQLELLARRNRLLADLPGGDLQVLLADGRHHVVGAQIQRGQFVRVQPDPHAVVPLAHVSHIGHALEPSQFVLDLDRGVIAQIDVVVAPVRRNQVDDHHRAG